MGEGLLVPFPGQSLLLYIKMSPLMAHVKGPRQGSTDHYSSVLLSQLNEGVKRGAETCSWTKQRAQHSHSSILCVSGILLLQAVRTAAALLTFPICLQHPSPGQHEAGRAASHTEEISPRLRLGGKTVQPWR